MGLGHEGRLYILASDHRSSLRETLFGITGEPNSEELERLRAAKRLVWAGFEAALAAGAPAGSTAVLFDEELGAAPARRAKEMGVVLAMPVEKSGQAVFDFEYGDDFGSHIAAFDPDFTKVLVRWNPDDDPETKAFQSERLLRLADWLRERDRKLLFELLVPASQRQLDLVGGDLGAYDRHLRPVFMLETIAEILGAGIEPDVWTIEGIDDTADCELVARLVRSGGRDGVRVVVLGRGADDARVGHWLESAAPVAGYAGFAVGRTIWWDGVRAWKDGDLDHEAAAAAIAAKFLQFIDTYERAQ